MTNLAERLRATAGPHVGPLPQLLHEAADEIEALERDLQRFRSDRAYTVGFTDGYDAREG